MIKRRKKKAKILSLDPSGVHHRLRKGSTGWAFLNGKILTNGTIKAMDYPLKHLYYEAIIKKIKECKVNVLVIENFRLQLGKAGAMTNRELQTSELIGLIEYQAEVLKIPKFVKQANTVKSRWPKRLVRLEIKDLELVHDKKIRTSHELDAIRHLLQYYIFKFFPK